MQASRLHPGLTPVVPAGFCTALRTQRTPLSAALPAGACACGHRRACMALDLCPGWPGQVIQRQRQPLEIQPPGGRPRRQKRRGNGLDRIIEPDRRGDHVTGPGIPPLPLQISSLPDTGPRVPKPDLVQEFRHGGQPLQHTQLLAHHALPAGGDRSQAQQPPYAIRHSLQRPGRHPDSKRTARSLRPRRWYTRCLRQFRCSYLPRPDHPMCSRSRSFRCR